MLTRFFADQRVRFVLVGATNTAVGYSVFVALQVLVFMKLEFGYLLSLAISYAVAITVAFFLYRRFVFVVSGNHLRDFAKFVTVYLAAISINALGLALLVESGTTGVIVGQLVMLAITTTLSYVGHRWFSFRRSPEKGTLTGTSGLDPT